jgi:hypothetical protein
VNNSVKRKRQLEGGFSSKSHEEVFPPSPTKSPEPVPSNDVGMSIEPPGSCRVSGTQAEVDLQSILLTKDALERYLAVEQKL